MPVIETIRAHVFAAERIHSDDTTVPVLAKGKTRTGRPGAQGAAARGVQSALERVGVELRRL
jgi:hypothetical protein